MKTDMTGKTNGNPTIAKYNALPVKMQIQAAKPPSASEPVSPINTLALLVL